jgi:hypothetical protein
MKIKFLSIWRKTRTKNISLSEKSGNLFNCAQIIFSFGKGND